MNTIPDGEIYEIAVKVNLTDVIAEIDLLCFQLDFYELGRWWNYKRSRRKLSHPAVADWMERYGFKNFSALPIGAVVAMRDSLKRYLAAKERGQEIAALPPKEESA